MLREEERRGADLQGVNLHEAILGQTSPASVRRRKRSLRTPARQRGVEAASGSRRTPSGPAPDRAGFLVAAARC
jgi:hypothetical protein